MHEFLLCDVFGCESEASDLTSDKSSCAVASQRITEPTAEAKSIFIGVQLMSLQLLTKGVFTLASTRCEAVPLSEHTQASLR